MKLYRTDQANPVKQVMTNENGFYSFGRQWKAKSKDENGNYKTDDYLQYYVEFEYDGAIYKATSVYGGDDDGNADGMQNLEGAIGSGKWRQGYADLPGAKSGKTQYLRDSNAYEFDDARNQFNREYQTIAFNKAYSGTEPTKDLNYVKNGHVSTLVENPNRVVKARSFIKQNYQAQGNGVQESLQNTNTLFLQSNQGNEIPETEYLKFINLGLVSSEEVDISIVGDVYSVKTTINGEEMTYDFADNKADSTSLNYNNHKNAYRLENAYELNLYESDFHYRKNAYYENETIQNYKENQSELTAEVTYRIKITNNQIQDDTSLKGSLDTPIDVAINEMAIYYDENFMSANDLRDLLELENTVKHKNENGFLEDKKVKAIRVHYGTEEELNKGTAQDIRDSISLNSRYESTKMPEDTTDKGYHAFYLTDDQMDKVYLEEGKSQYIELTFVVDKQEVDNVMRTLKITDNKQDNMGLELIAEVSAYTTRYNPNYEHKGLAGQMAGLIDRDSNPGNLNLNGIEDYANYEDDKYKMGVKLGILKQEENGEDEQNPQAMARSISGFVWEDARSNQIGETKTGIQYLGNGEYNVKNKKHENAKGTGTQNDKTIEGVKVSLLEVIQIRENQYYEQPARYTCDIKDAQGNTIHQKDEKITAITDENGHYTLNGFIPGYYKVRFDYGYDENQPSNLIYNGQDYKSTTYKKSEQEYASDNIGSKENFDYFDNVKQTLEQQNKSDAQDDEIRRLNVNSYSETMTTKQVQVFSDIENHKRALIENTKMYAESAIFYTKPEEKNSGEENIKVNGNFDESRLWKIKDLDFGLEYRPEALIQLNKNIASVELVTSDNKTLVKLCFNEDKSINTWKSIGYQNVQFLPNQGKDGQGFVYMNIDKSLLEGCTVKVEYEMNAENASEVDRVNQNLANIQYEIGANSYGNDFKVYTKDATSDEYQYSANATAAQLLASQYLDDETYGKYKIGRAKDDAYEYLKKLKKPYKTSNKTNVSKVELVGQEYYGMYLGQTYYTGQAGKNDQIAGLKVDHILDYIDNDFSFNLAQNNTENRLWKSVTSEELKDKLDWKKVYQEEDKLVDRFGVQYDTENRSNLALSVDSNKKGNDKNNGNSSISRFLNTKNATGKKDEYTGKMSIALSKVLSADDVAIGKSLSFENIAEVIQYTTLTGRKTANHSVIADSNVAGNNTAQDDTGIAEKITISPPTGLPKQEKP